VAVSASVQLNCTGTFFSIRMQFQKKELAYSQQAIGNSGIP